MITQVEIPVVELSQTEFPMVGIQGVGESSVRKVKPYISGHVTDGSSTFTFKVNNADVTVSVSGGDWEYKPTTAITSLAFVGVPQLESLELNKITGVSTFNLDYPVVPVFKKCDATTEAALNYVYHIRGTATSNFPFTLKYIDGSNNETTVTENAVINGDGKWDVAYSGKKISSLRSTFQNKTALTSLDFSKCDDFDKVTTIYYLAYQSDNLKSMNFNGKKFSVCQDCTAIIPQSQDTPLENISFPDALFENQTLTIHYMFNKGYNVKKISIPLARFSNVTSIDTLFRYCESLEELHLDSATFENVTNTTNAFGGCNSLVDLFVPNSSTFPKTLKLSDSPLSYDSMLRVAGWLKDLTGDTAQTITFKADTYNALTAEQKAALTAIIVTEKGWNLATA